MSGSTRPLAEGAPSTEALTRSAGAITRSLALGGLVLCCLLVVLGALPAVGAGASTANSGQANVTVTTETTDGTVSATVRITNTGETTGRYAIQLVAEGDGLVAERDLRVPPNGTRQAAFEAEVSGTTTYVVYVNDVEIERFTVTAPEESAASNERTVPGPIVVSLFGGVLFLVVGAALFRLS